MCKNRLQILNHFWKKWKNSDNHSGDFFWLTLQCDIGISHVESLHKFGIISE